MTKQLITLLGALISAAVIVAAVLIGVVPLVGGVFSAFGQRLQVATTNSAYESQIASLTKQKERLDEIQDAVEDLRSRIPEAERLNEVFERIARSEDSAGVQVVSVSRGDLVPYAVRSGADDAAATASPQAPAANEAADPDSANGVEGQTDAAGAATDGAGTDGAGATGQPAAPAASARQQIELSISITAPDIASAVAFLDALRAGPRAIAIDNAVIAGSPGAFDVKVTVLTFVQSEGGE